MTSSSEALDTRRLRLYFERARQAAVPSPLATVLLAWLSLESCGWEAAGVWMALVAVADGATVIHTGRWLRTEPPPSNTLIWQRRQQVLHVLTGLAWGMAAVLLHGPEERSMSYGDVHLLWLVGVSGMSTAAMSVHRGTLVAFLSGLWLPTTLLLVSSATAADFELLVGLGLLTFLELRYARTLRDQSEELLSRQVEQDRLLAALDEAQSALRTSNTQLIDRNSALQIALGEVTRLATHDVLTGLPNRRHLTDRIEEITRSASASGEPVALLFFDLDHFKLVNDTHGHAAGDRVLREVAAHVTSWIRPSDEIGRWGGEEFVVVLRDAPAGAGSKVAEDLRRLIERAPVSHQGATVRVTASFGVAEFARGEATDNWVRRADEACYAAKQAGRNRVALALAA